jgi:hypothetical protein
MNTDRPARMPTLRQLQRTESKLKRQLVKMARKEDAYQKAKHNIERLRNHLFNFREVGFGIHSDASKQVEMILEHL